MWFLVSTALATPFHDASAVTFTDAVNLRAAPDTEAEVVATLPLGTGIEILAEGESLSLWGRRAPWLQVHTSHGEGWVWGGVVSERFAATSATGDGVSVGIRGVAPLEHGHSRVSVEVAARQEGTVLAPAGADLVIPSAWTSEGTPFQLEIVDSGLPGAEPVVRLSFSAEACAGLMGNMVYARDGARMVHLATLHEGFDAPYFLSDELVFPGESGGEEGTVLRVTQAGEYDDDGSRHLSRDQTSRHRLVDGSLQPPLE